MKVPLSLLKEFLPIDLDAAAIAAHLTLLGMEVEGIHNEKPMFSHVVAAEILSVMPHPSADKLVVLEVSDGTKKYDIVCGDSSCKKGERVPLAKMGAKLFTPDGIKTIEKATLRGVPSEGMLCSAKELHLFSELPGVLRLDPEIPLGTDLELLLWDPVLDVALTPNLGHCMSVLGIARDLAAFLNKPLQIPKIDLQQKGAPQAKVNIEAPLQCKRYAFRTLENVVVTTSPYALRRKLELLGIRPINNIVDITNLILYQYGQPLHAFDLDKIEGPISVKVSEKEIPFHFLDDKTRNVPVGSLFITDKKKPLALAGIMGGLSSSVTTETKRVLLESAYFDPMTIRKTAKQLGLKTESSSRFEKGVDPNFVIYALDAASQLMGGTANTLSDQTCADFSPRPILCRVDRTSSILGHKFSVSEVENIFHRLGFQTKSKNETVTAFVPPYRHDIQGEIDLIEEVARIYGYNHLEKKDPYFTISSIPHAPLYLFENKVRELLRAENLTELLTADLISKELATLAQETPSIEVLHSKSEEHKFLRTSLLPGLLQVMNFNISRKNTNLHGFEIGRIHFKQGASFVEQTVMGVILTGEQSLPHWSRPSVESDFFDVKGILENTLDALGCKEVLFTPSQHPSFHPYRQANLFIQKQNLGVLGELHPDLLSKFSIKHRLFYGELNLSLLLPLTTKERTMTALPIYPGSERDWTLTVQETLPIEDIIKEIRSPLLEKVELTSLYKSDKLGPDKKNVTLRFYYRDQEKTVSYEEVEKEHARISAHVSKILNLV